MKKSMYGFVAVMVLAAMAMFSSVAAQAAELAPKELTTALEQWFDGKDAAAMPVFKRMVEAGDENPIPFTICQEAYYLGKYDCDELIQAKYSARQKMKKAADYYNAVAEQIFAAANAGKPRAEFLAGVMLGDVPGVKNLTDKSAASWLAMSAKHGDPCGQNRLGSAYFGGFYDLEKSIAQARKWLTKAAAQGHENARCSLASSNIVPKSTGFRDVFEGTKLYKQAAKKGFARGEFRYGRSLLYGWGVARDVKEALKWMDKAASKHNYQAASLLAELYRNGEEGVTKDELKVAEYVSLKREYERERDKFRNQ